MANWGAGLGGLAQGVAQGYALGSKVQADKRQTEFAQKMGALLDKWSQPAGVAPAAEAQPMPAEQTPMITPQPQTATPPAVAQVGYSPLGSGVGLGTQPMVPMVTRPQKTATKPPFTSGLGY